jgi:hypothetical protein
MWECAFQTRLRTIGSGPRWRIDLISGSIKA